MRRQNKVNDKLIQRGGGVETPIQQKKKSSFFFYGPNQDIISISEMKCLMSDFRERIRIKRPTRIRIIVNYVTQKLRNGNGGEIISRDR